MIAREQAKNLLLASYDTGLRFKLYRTLHRHGEQLIELPWTFTTHLFGKTLLWPDLVC